MIKDKLYLLIAILILILVISVSSISCQSKAKPEKELTTQETSIETEKENTQVESTTISDKQVDTEEKMESTETEATNEKQEEYTVLEIGQAFDYKDKTIALKDNYTAECSILGEQGRKELFIYLFVENTSDKPCTNIYGYELELYHNEEKSDIFFGLGVLGVCDEIELYNILGHEELNPGEVSEGWITAGIPIDWEEEDLEIYFNDFEKIPSTVCIWKLK